MLARTFLSLVLLGTAVALIGSCATLAGLEDSELRPDAGANGGRNESDGSSNGGASNGGGGRQGTSGGGAGSSGASMGGTGGTTGGPYDAGLDAEAGGGCALRCEGGCVPNDVHNCGSCGHDCTNLPHVSGTISCNAGQCSFPPASCASGWTHCTTNADQGCETDISRAANCGGCGTMCPSAMPACSPSGATYACVTGCSGATPTLCGATCVNTASNPNHCGMCGRICMTSVTHAQPSCASGTCGFSCNSGYTPCSGACVDEKSDNNNCGGCGTQYACTGGRQCVNSSCQCPSGQNFCGGQCVPNSVNACGSACSTCTAPTNGTVSCSSAGNCVPSCNATTPTYCSSTNSCLNTTADPNHCGSCSKVCTGGATCTSSQCIINYGFSFQFTDKLDLIPTYLLGLEITVPTSITVQKLGAIVSNVAGQVILALYQADGSGTLHLVAETAATSLVGSRNEISVTTPKLISAGNYWVFAEFSNLVSVYRNGAATMTRRLSTSVTFGGVPDPYPFNASTAGNNNPLNYYVIGAQ